jgi:hypothetical protein
VCKMTVLPIFWNNRFEDFMVMLLNTLQYSAIFLVKKCVMFALTSLTWNLLFVIFLSDNILLTWKELEQWEINL